jgi:hypothetical protein
MSTFFFIAALIALAGVVVTLFGGLAVMSKPGEKNRFNSNKLMELRIGLQGLAVFLLLLAYLTK